MYVHMYVHVLLISNTIHIFHLHNSPVWQEQTDQSNRLSWETRSMQVSGNGNDTICEQNPPTWREVGFLIPLGQANSKGEGVTKSWVIEPIHCIGLYHQIQSRRTEEVEMGGGGGGGGGTKWSMLDGVNGTTGQLTTSSLLGKLGVMYVCNYCSHHNLQAACTHIQHLDSSLIGNVTARLLNLQKTVY